MLLRKSRSYAEGYNDLDGDVVNLFRVLRDEFDAARLESAVGLTPFARDEFDAAYHRLATDPVERARQLLLLSHGGFGTAAMRSTRNGKMQRTGFRASTTRLYTTPAGDWRGFPSVVADVAERMTGVVIEHRDAALVMGSHDGPETLHYVDPPYPHATRSNSSKNNYRHELSDDDHRRLSVALHNLEGYVVLSGYACELYDRELYGDWRRVAKSTHADGARDRVEVLWINPRCAKAIGLPDQDSAA